METYLKITEIGGVKQTKDGGDYRVVKFRPYNVLPNGTQIYTNERDRVRCLFDAHKDFPADPLYRDIQNGEIKLGAVVYGTIVKFNTTEYCPEGFAKPVNVFTAVVFSNEDATKVANRQLKQNYACTVDAFGTLTAPEQLNSSVVHAS